MRFVDAVDYTGLSTLHQQAAIIAVPSLNVTSRPWRAAHPSSPAVSVELPEVVVEGRTGYLVEPGDVTDLRRLLEGLLDDPASARAMGESGRRLVLERLTSEACARRCAATYGELVA